MDTENNNDKANEIRKVCSYKIYTQDGKFTEMGSGKVTLLINFGGGSNGNTPITGLAMTMDGSSGTDEVLIPSGFTSSSGGTNMHVRLKGSGSSVNAIYGRLTRPLYRGSRLILPGEYIYVGKPFQDVLPDPPTGHDFYYILFREDDTEGLEDTEPISMYFD
ncbi:hypothetical protein [Dokdonia sp.]|uniref:hypothetical protein n=1 Tax=Dokdonia sp. TaxID=2024995 RepID=UPI0032634C3A